MEITIRTREFYIKHGWEQRSEAANFVKVLPGK
jgi:hypothetical protein